MKAGLQRSAFFVIFADMTTALIQNEIIWGDDTANRQHLNELIAKAGARANLYVLPEMFSTGFATSETDAIENEPCTTLEWMKSKAAELDAALCGSIALRLGDGRCVNRMYFVYPDGRCVHYDKRHLFTYGGEHRRFSGGEQRVIVEYKGIRFLLAVCYDLRFPVWLRNRGDYDAMIIVASWPESRRYAWDTLGRARAIENQCFVLAVNRNGDDPNCSYNGGTALIGPKGETIAAAEDGKEQVLVADMDISGLKAFRASFPALDDKDNFEIVPMFEIQIKL